MTLSKEQRQEVRALAGKYRETVNVYHDGNRWRLAWDSATPPENAKFVEEVKP